jgi:hypothetical protein
MPKKGGSAKAKAAAPKQKTDEERAQNDAMLAKAKAIAAEDEKRRTEETAKRDAADRERYESYGLSPEDIKEFREMFQLVDSDGGGSIGRDEVLDLMRLVGYQCTEEEVDDMISEIDEDGNMEIDFDEFVTMMSRKPEALREPEEIMRAFKARGPRRPALASCWVARRVSAIAMVCLPSRCPRPAAPVRRCSRRRTTPRPGWCATLRWCTR